MRTKHEPPEPIGGGTPPAEMAAPGASGNRAAAQQPTARQLRQNDDRQVLTRFSPKNATERLLCRFSPKNRQKRPENQIRRLPARSRAKPKPPRLATLGQYAAPLGVRGQSNRGRERPHN